MRQARKYGALSLPVMGNAYKGSFCRNLEIPILCSGKAHVTIVTVFIWRLVNKTRGFERPICRGARYARLLPHIGLSAF